MTSLAQRAVEVLLTASPEEKTKKSIALAAEWRAGAIAEIGRAEPPMQPARPAKPEILPPGKMPRRGPGGTGKATLMHALAHIEFNAIDLAWDIIARFTDHDLPRDFYDDWVKVAADETEHFLLLVGLLRDLGSDYGAFPAHAGLWEAAEKTAHDLQARLAVVPMTFEARALDTAPPLMEKLRQAKDEAGLAVLQRIFDDEIVHVAIGARWFEVVCARAGEDQATAYQRLVSPHFPKGLKQPFNHEGRQQAGLPQSFYGPLAS
ncbi:MAG TPA: ferritin-like domain-containing protein [Magnetospirillaceae bacterium]|nr:ferritin-like domain-containing protein [Magnetospirillaceae bacterium]